MLVTCECLHHAFFSLLSSPLLSRLHCRFTMANSPPKSAGGVLQIPAAATQKNAPKPVKKPPKPPTPRLKLLVRRLPPGLTQSEFENALDEEWKTGGGKVDWLQYKPGKVSKE